jgi:hypothetical protein
MSYWDIKSWNTLYSYRHKQTRGGTSSEKRTENERIGNRGRMRVRWRRKQEVLGSTSRLFSFYTTWVAYKTPPPTIVRCCRNVFTESLPSNDKGIRRPRFSFDTIRTAQKATPPTIILLLGAFVAIGTCLLSCCLATIRGNAHTDTDYRDEFIKYTVDMGSDTMIHIPSFIKIGSDVQKLRRGGD